MSVTAQAITPDVLGAWVIKCNPRTTDVASMLDAGRADERWCVAGNYRTQLMTVGQRVVFWVSGDPRRRGIWGVGHLTGAAEPGPRWKVPTDIVLFSQPVLATALMNVPALSDLEVFRAPQQANPSWISVDQWAALSPLLPGPSSEICVP